MTGCRADPVESTGGAGVKAREGLSHGKPFDSQAAAGTGFRGAAS